MPRQKPVFWQSRSVFAVILLPLAALFWCVVGMRRTLFRWGWLRSVRLPVPVIVVGNIAVGGSGKTPVVQWLIAALRTAGYQPGIVSRGYGSTATSVRLVTAACDPAECGDEPVLLARSCLCPVAIGVDRPAAAKALLQAFPQCDVIIADDGLQHYRLHRDIEVVVVDSVTLGNRWLMPSGPLREGLSRLARVDLLLAHGEVDARIVAAARDVPIKRMRLHGDTVHPIDAPDAPIALASFAGRRVHAIAGIGHPERFFSQLTAAGAEVVPHSFPDHHRFVASDVDFAADGPKIMTAKDAVKCLGFALTDTWVLPVSARIESGAIEQILEKLTHGREVA